MRQFRYFLLSVCILLAEPVRACNKTCIASAAKSRLEEIKIGLLSKLNIKDPEAILPSDRIPLGVLSQLERSTLEAGNEEGIENGDISTVAIAATSPEDSDALVSEFKMSADTSYSRVTKAVLTVYLDMMDLPPSTVYVRVFERALDGSLSAEPIGEQSFAVEGSQTVSIELPGFDVVRLGMGTGIFVEAFVDGLNVAVHPQQSSDPSQQMVLILTVDNSKKSRRKRQEPYCTPDSQQQGCCLHDLVVDFKELGWNFIIAPRKYNAYMCRGDCRVNHHHLTRFGHTKVMHDGKESHPSLETGMCCHPSDYESLKVIYMKGDTEIGITRVPGMIARRCTCS